MHTRIHAHTHTLKAAAAAIRGTNNPSEALSESTFFFFIALFLVVRFMMITSALGRGVHSIAVFCLIRV